MNPSDRRLRIPSEKPVLTQVLIISFVILYAFAAFAPQISVFLYEKFPIAKLPIISGQWWRLITGAFLHDPTSPVHVALNSFSLFSIGMDIESFFGRLRFAAIYIVSLLGGSIASFIFMPLYGAGSEGVGASGAVFGVFGALTVFYALNRNLFGRFGKLNFRLAIILLIANLGIGYGLTTSGIAPIDNSAHIGGLISGAAVGFLLCPRYTLGAWRNPVTREVENVNTGRLSWVAVGLAALIVIGIFVDAQIYFHQ